LLPVGFGDDVAPMMMLTLPPKVLEMVCGEIGLTADLTYYFCLVVVECEEGAKAAQVVRTMQHFESPHVSVTRGGMETKQIQLRKAYWDVDLDAKLLHDPVALNLLYVVHFSRYDGFLKPSESNLFAHR
jgi:hypothetical protein